MRGCLHSTAAIFESLRVTDSQSTDAKRGMWRAVNNLRLEFLIGRLNDLEYPFGIDHLKIAPRLCKP